MKHTLKSVRTLAATLITFGSLAGGANAAISFIVNTQTGLVTTSGSYTLLDAATSSIGVSRLLPDSGGTWGFFVAGAASTPLSPGIGFITTSLNFTSPLTWTITDTSAGGSLLAEASINSWFFPFSSILNLFDATITSGDLNANVDAGDLLTFSGSTTLIADSLAAVSALSDSSHTSTYNGETFTLSFTSVPEPSSAFLLGLGSLGLLARRRRIK